MPIRWRSKCREEQLSTTSSCGSHALGIHVVSMRNKVNRLEEIFMRLVDDSVRGRGEQR